MKEIIKELKTTGQYVVKKDEKGFEIKDKLIELGYKVGIMCSGTRKVIYDRERK